MVCFNVPAVLLLLVTGLARAGDVRITPEEFQLFFDWKDNKDDPRLVKDNDANKIRKIAQSLRVNATDLKKAIGRVEPAFPTLKADTEKLIREQLDKTPLKKAIRDVEVNIDTNHPVALVKWTCGDARDSDKEAAYVAWAVSQGGSIIKTAAVWCVNEADTKLFSAKIGRDQFQLVDVKSVDRFASSRYIKLFEDVKRGPHT